MGYSSSAIGTASVPSVGAVEHLVQACPVHDVVVDVGRYFVLTKMDHPALDPGHHDRVPQRRVQQVEIHVAERVAAEFFVAALNIGPAQEVGNPGKLEELGDVLEEPVEENKPG